MIQKPSESASTQPFQRKDPEAAEWQKAYAVIESAKAGEVIYDEALAEAMGRPIDTGAKLGPVYRAIDELERVHQRSANRVREVGFVIVEGWDHFKGRVQQRRRRSLRATALGSRSSKRVNRFALNAEQRKAVDEAEATADQILDMQRTAYRRTKSIEDALDKIRKPRGAS